MIGEPFVLPSRGLLYGGKIPDGKVEVASMTTKEEKVLLGGRKSQFGEVLDYIFKSCTDIKMDPQELLISDRTYLLFAIRSVSYGKQFSFPWKCASCGESSTHQMQDLLGDLRVDYYETGVSEPFSTTLPSGSEIGFRMLRGSDERKLTRLVKADENSRNIGDPAYIPRLALYVVKIDGKEVDYLTAHNFILNLRVSDTSAFKSAIDKNSSGIYPMVDVSCMHCGYDQRMAVGPSEDFFRVSSVSRS